MTTRRAALCTTFIAILAALPGVFATAQIRPDTRTMPCKDAQTLVRTMGAVVLTTGEYTFGRFVASRRYCLPGEMTIPALAATLDRERCRLGYHCASREMQGGT